MSSSTTNHQEQITESETTPSEITDLEPWNRNETFDTEDDNYSGSQEQADKDNKEVSYKEVQDGSIDILDQLVEIFVKRNGREPNEEEVMQWIEVFKSLKIEDGGEDDDAQQEGQHEDTAETPVVDAAA